MKRLTSASTSPNVTQVLTACDLGHGNTLRVWFTRWSLLNQAMLTDSATIRIVLCRFSRAYAT
jgi:hypothetical protein